jgi:hypothetical protein
MKTSRGGSQFASGEHLYFTVCPNRSNSVSGIVFEMLAQFFYVQFVWVTPVPDTPQKQVNRIFEHFCELAPELKSNETSRGAHGAGITT